MLILCTENQNLSIEIILRKDMIAAAATGALFAWLVTVLVRLGSRRRKEGPKESKAPVGIIQSVPGYPRETDIPVSVGETSVLSKAGEDIRISDGMIRIPTATLIRRRTGERIRIYREVFTLGKDHHKADYCISGNGAVSRLHAHIRCRGGTYYITDINSTNFTFVNGQKITPNQEVKLSSGDKILLADEEFVFFETVSI